MALSGARLRRESELGPWVGALFHLSLFLTAPRMVLPQDPSTDYSAAPQAGQGGGGEGDRVRPRCTVCQLICERQTVLSNANSILKLMA